MSEQEHYKKYETMAQEIGIEALKSFVLFDKQLLIDAHMSGDVHFNDSTKLRQWDAMQGYVISYAVQPMSLSDCVCVLKHVARYHIVKADIPVP